LISDAVDVSSENAHHIHREPLGRHLELSTTHRSQRSGRHNFANAVFAASISMSVLYIPDTLFTPADSRSAIAWRSATPPRRNIEQTQQWMGRFMRRGGFALLAAIAATALTGCDSLPTPSGKDEDAKARFDLYGTYTFSGDSPGFSVDKFASSPAITCNGSFAGTGALHRINLYVRNVSIYDGKENYEIIQTEVQEEVEKEWISFTEFENSVSPVKGNIGVVLALDASTSLGDDFAEVKNSANAFIATVLAGTDYDAKIGVVSFSDSVRSSPIGAGAEELTKFINEMRQGQYTALYDGMLRGIDMLASLPDSVAKALVTFTDGRDNYSVNTSGEVIGKLEEQRIKSFTVGFLGKGELDEDILTRLAHNGIYQAVQNEATLQKVFGSFSKSVTRAYNVTYTRNDQRVLTRRIRLTFHCRAKE
jgi:hypothetical protein